MTAAELRRREAWMKHEIVARLVRCRCGQTMPYSAFEEHFRAEVRKAARLVIRRSLTEFSR